MVGIATSRLFAELAALAPTGAPSPSSEAVRFTSKTGATNMPIESMLRFTSWLDIARSLQSGQCVGDCEVKNIKAEPCMGARFVRSLQRRQRQCRRTNKRV